MGQDVRFVQVAGKKRKVSVCDTSIFNRTSPVVSEDLVYDDACLLEPAVFMPALAETSFITEFFIRTVDVIGCVFIFLVTAPIIFFTASLVKLTSRGSVLYSQERVGKAGKIFMLYKFRTMIDGAEKKTGPILAAKDDGRVTFVGRFLRRTRLDELPQLFNVLRGDMSLVGPRPERPFFVSRHKALQGIRLAVKPGITGLAQIRAFYDLKPEHKLKYDSLYIQNRSLLLNLSILLQTIPVIFLKRGW